MITQNTALSKRKSRVYPVDNSGEILYNEQATKTEKDSS